jgi:hypothetical protein
MDALEANTHSFIVKIWSEDSKVKTSQAVWRGQITHVLSGEQLVFDDLDDIRTFIRNYLNEDGREGSRNLDAT